MLKRAAIFLAIILCACHEGDKRPPETRKLDTIAYEQGAAYWNRVVTKCGEDHFTVYVPTKQILQMKGFMTSTFPDSKWMPSEVDKMNGLDWLGQCYTFVSAYRTFQTNKWSEWQSGALFGSTFGNVGSFLVRHKKDAWIINDGKALPFDRIECGQIPQG